MTRVPAVSICSYTSPTTTFAEDAQLAAQFRFDGVGVAEDKMTSSRDEIDISALERNGLRASVCIPRNIAPLPLSPAGPFGGPDNPEARLDLLCASVRRLARLKPACILLLTGSTSASDTEARRLVVEGIREAARVAKADGISLGIEPAMAGLSIVNDLDATVALIEEIDEPNVGVLYDVANVAGTVDAVASTARHAQRVVGVHVNDRLTAAIDGDRCFPGDGILDVPSLLAALERGGYTGWYDVEVFSDWLRALPVDEIFARARCAWDRTWRATCELC
jgi:sugar phosphate isomerase/epimerase